MKTIRTKMQDGYELIIGIDELHIDPMASRRERTRLFQESEEWKALKPKLERLRELNNDFYNAKKVKKEAEKKSIREAIQAHIDKLAQEINDMKEAVELAKEKAHEDGTERFSCRKGEVIVEEHELAEIESKLNILAPGEYLLRTGAILVDNRGKIFWRKVEGKWERQAVTMLGEKIKEGMQYASDLEPDEIAELVEIVDGERISDLPDEEKQKEKVVALAKLISESVNMRSMLEIQNTADPLAETQTWYNAEKLKLEERYK